MLRTSFYINQHTYVYLTDEERYVAIDPEHLQYKVLGIISRHGAQLEYYQAIDEIIAWCVSTKYIVDDRYRDGGVNLYIKDTAAALQFKLRWSK